MSLPNAKSSEPATGGDSSGREGRLSTTSVPELLARAYRVRFTGSLVLEPVDQAPSVIRFVGGAVTSVSGPFQDSELEWQALGRYLPPDTLEFAKQHSADYGVTPFDAVTRLVLLPPESVVAARQALTASGVETLCGLSGDVRYAFVAPMDGEGSGGAPVLEPLGLLAACFLIDSQRERAALSVAPHEHVNLSVDAERARRIVPTLSGPVRAVLESLIRSPTGVQGLRERSLVPNAELIAAVCALWITREIVVPSPSVPSAFPPSRFPPRPSAAPLARGVPPFHPATSSMPPPRKDSGFVRAGGGAAESAAREHAMEQKVEEAWMRAEADPSRAHQITSIVTKAIGVYPKNPRLHYYLARLHIQANRVEEAVKELERVLELDPEDAKAASELAAFKSRFGGAVGSR
ncbi:MAG TPA: tetratricopeptide repeat protein [Polyangiaceae bacterium]